MSKRNFIILIFIILFPSLMLLGYYLKQPKQKAPGLAWTVPKLSEQPKDTEVEKGLVSIHHWTTKEETPVYFVPTENLPMIDIWVSFDAGSSRDGGSPGLANLTSKLLNEGSATLTGQQIASQFENVGALYETKLERDKMTLALRTLTDQTFLFSVVDTFADLIAHPTFAEPALTNTKNQVLLSLKKNQQHPSTVGFEAFLKAIYGTHPYGHLTQGTEQGIQSITQADLLNFHQQFLVAKNAIIVIVGGIHRDHARDISQRISAQLLEGRKPDPLPEVQDLSKSILLKIPFASQQTHLLIGQPVRTVDDPDRFPLQVGNYILGEGSLVSRLFTEIRDKRGLAYRIGSRFYPLREPGPFLIQVQTKANQTRQVLTLIQDNLKQFIDKGPTDNEVEAAKKGLIGAFPLSMNTNAKIAEWISDITFYGLPLDYLETYQKKIAEVSPAKIREVFKHRLHPDSMATVMVGENES